MDQALEADAGSSTSDVERADAAGAEQAPAGEAEEVGAQGADVHLHPGGRLRRVDVEPGSVIGQRRPDLGDRLQRADLVVGQLDGDEGRVVPERGNDLRRRDPAPPIDADPRDVEALRLEPTDSSR